MKSEWITASVAELEADGTILVQDGNHGENRPLRHELDPAGTPHIRAADISDSGVVDFDGAQRINDQALARIRKGVGAPGDVILTHKGTVGRVARVPARAPHFVCSPQTTFWRSREPDRLDQGFLFGYLRSPEFAAQLKRRMHESDMAPYVSLTAQRSLLVPLPPIERQRAIAAVLAALDDKIDSNRRLAGLLDEMAAALVERAQFMDSALVRLGDVCVFHNKRRIPLSAEERSRRPGPYPYYGATGVIDHVDEFLFSGPHVLAGEDGSVQTVDGHPVLQYVWGDFWVNNHAHVLTFIDSVPEIGYLVLRYANVSPFVTGAVQPKLSMRRLRDVPVRWPRHSTSLGSSVGALFERFRGAKNEVATLGELRDALLPKLVSGELRVSDTSDAAEMIEPMVA